MDVERRAAPGRFESQLAARRTCFALCSARPAETAKARQVFCHGPCRNSAWFFCLHHSREKETRASRPCHNDMSQATTAAASGQLSGEQVNRYRRHLILPEVGVEGQKKLLNSKVLCIGAGGLGCPISLYLSAAGVGTIGLADVDVVSPSNLQRQVLFGQSVVREPKVEAAAKKLKDLNPDLKLIAHKAIVNSSNVM